MKLSGKSEMGSTVKIENEQTHYRARFELCPYATDSPAIVEAYRSIYQWIYTKESRRAISALFEQMKGVEAQARFLKGSFNYPGEYRGGLNRNQSTALATDALMSKSGARIPDAWALEYDEPDGSFPFRHWHTRIGLSTTPDDTCIINLNVSYYTLPNYVGKRLHDPHPNIPNLMRTIVGLSDYQCTVGETAIEADPIALTASTFKTEFVDNLISPDRHLPLILMVSDFEGKYSVEDPAKLASSLLGLANVYTLDYRDLGAKLELFNLFRKDTPAYRYNCTRGSIRLYRPGLSLDDAASSSNHRFFTWDDVQRYGSVDNFIEMLNRSLSRSFIKGDSDVVGIEDIDRLRNARELEERSERISKLQKKLDATFERLLNKSTIPADLPDAQTIEKLNEQINDLQGSLKEAILLNKEYDSTNINLDNLLKAAKKENADLQQQLASAETNGRLINEANDRAARYRSDFQSLVCKFRDPANLPSFIKDLRDEVELAERLWGNRIAVLDEAYRSAKEYRYYDLEEEWKIISAAANELWDIFFKEGIGEMPDDEIYRRTGIQGSMTEGAATREHPEWMRLRDRTYLGKTIRCEPHLKGTGKNVRNKHFRLHFYIDYDNSKIVIGHCGLHLTSASTE